MLPKVSIIVPVYKAEKYLNRCVDSILAQTLTDFECILIDDGSPDNCPAICDEYAKKDSRIKVIHQKNSGVSAARNRGIDEANGDWIGFVDSDDWIDSKTYETAFNYTKSNSVEIVQWGMCSTDLKTFNKKEVFEKDFDFRNLEIGKEYASGCNKLFNKAFLDNNKIRFREDISYGEDLIFAFHCFSLGRTGNIKNKAYYYYFQNEQSVCHIPSEKNIQTYIEAINCCEKIIKENNGNCEILDSHKIAVNFNLLKLKRFPDFRKIFPKSSYKNVKSIKAKILFIFIRFHLDFVASWIIDLKYKNK